MNIDHTSRARRRASTETPERAARLVEHAFALHRSDPVNAAREADEALMLAMVLGERRIAARCLSVLAECRRRTGAADEALALIERMSATAEELGDTRMRAQSLHQCGMILHTLGRSADAVDALQQAIALAAELPESDVMITARDTLGVVYQALGMLPEALAEHLRATELLEGAPTSEAVASAHANIAALYMHLGQFSNARSHTERALAVYRLLGNATGQAGALMNLGVAYQEQGQPLAALELYKQALALARDLPAAGVLLPILLGNIGTCFQQSGDHRAALAHLLEAADLARTAGPDTRARVLCSLGALHAESGALEEARAALSEGMAIAAAIGDPELHGRYHAHMARVEERAGNTRAALDHTRKAAALRDAVAGDRTHDRIQELRINHEVRRIAAEREHERERADALAQAAERKDAELAAMALQLAQRQRALARLKDDVERAQRSGRRGRALANDVRAAIEHELRADDWEHFQRHFDTIHPQFAAALAARHTGLTPTEFRICTLVRLQLSSKEIAELLCISRLTVDTHRQRLRRKLGVPPRAGLAGFLLSL